MARGLEDNVTLMGHIERPKEFLEEMDVLVLPSHREVLPMVLLESLAVGTNVVVIDRGGIREVISDEQVGFIIKEHDKEAFAQCIRTLCSDRDLRHSMSKRGRQRVEQNFSIEKMLESTYGQYAKSKTSSGGLD
ncbi:glycosyltransferase [Geomicrobium sp. JCM 19038]|uniref:glycosyltransferase n=1 Tax=Geomicrobium sp. JCM 19038 TaxID=1460635 RepID=UPI00045F19C4|nr:glycosyltransferase [Geomicrobium sp. JCM 19038]GAK08403.1 glycosyltransferase [Geomicrobium sp. JCM 19038]